MIYPQFQIMNPQKWDPKLYHLFLEYFLFEPASIFAAKHLFNSRAVGTWRIYMRAARMVWSQARVAEVEVFPLSGEKLMKIFDSVRRGKWSARNWIQIRAYLKIVCTLNNYEMDQRVAHVIMGQARVNIVTLAPKKERPVFSPEQMRQMLYKIKSVKKSHVQQRGLIAIYLAYFAVGRGFDVSHLKGEHLEFTEKSVKINFHIRKNNKLALKRHVATVYATYGYLCPVLNLLKGIAYLGIGPNDYIFHLEGQKEQQMSSSSIIQGVKNLQRQASCSPVLTLTDVRASATSALAQGGVSTYLIMLWGNWSTNQIEAYARSNEGLKRKIQGVLDL